jgi:hypothetical protein
MRHLIAAVVALSTSACGCGRFASMEWEFKVGHPSVISSPIVVQELGSRGLGMYPVASMPGMPPQRMQWQQTSDSGYCVPAPSASTTQTPYAAPPPCDLLAICEALMRIEKRLAAAGPGAERVKPMEKGPERPPE